MKLELNSNFYLINKPKSWTSQDLCTKFKKLYNFNKVGHSGTLDPNATGLMLIATNKYTKLFDYITNKDKTYVVKTLFGYDSETLDIDSNYEKIHEIDLNKIKDEFINAVNNKKGESLQIPPKYSAVKVKGKRLYKYAREGKEVEIPKRKINVKKIEIGNLDINHNCFISNIEELNNKFIPNSISSDEIIDLPVINVKEKDLDNIKNGELMSNTFFKTKEIYILKYEGNVVATYKPFNEEYFKPDKVIL